MSVRSALTTTTLHTEYQKLYYSLRSSLFHHEPNPNVLFLKNIFLVLIFKFAYVSYIQCSNPDKIQGFGCWFSRQAGRESPNLQSFHPYFSSLGIVLSLKISIMGASLWGCFVYCCSSTLSSILNGCPTLVSLNQKFSKYLVTYCWDLLGSLHKRISRFWAAFELR